MVCTYIHTLIIYIYRIHTVHHSVCLCLVEEPEKPRRGAGRFRGRFDDLGSDSARALAQMADAASGEERT